MPSSHASDASGCAKGALNSAGSWLAGAWLAFALFQTDCPAAGGVNVVGVAQVGCGDWFEEVLDFPLSHPTNPKRIAHAKSAGSARSSRPCVSCISTLLFDSGSTLMRSNSSKSVSHSRFPQVFWHVLPECDIGADPVRIAMDRLQDNRTRMPDCPILFRRCSRFC